MENTELKYLGVEQAIDDGYEYYGQGGLEWQATQDLADLTEEDVEESDLYLFDKVKINVSVDADTLIEAAFDAAKDCVESCDDMSNIEDAIKGAVDWDDVASKVNDALGTLSYYSLSKIKLVWP